ncbi:MAG: AAA-like domain-containing protein, partial [Deltaproteobacteria bacterium]|nr:AAA-like domain-containing protein [Deltaproteobacteria bacterium]
MSQQAIKTFNTAGPCVPSKHYMLPVLPRQEDVDEMIQGGYYFVLHAPRQSGKTTYLLDIVNKINNEGQYYALYCSLEALDKLYERKPAIDEILNQIFISLRSSNIKNYGRLLSKFKPPIGFSVTTNIKLFLNYLCEKLNKELIIFFDEADCLTEEPLVTFLRQIRQGYNTRSSLNSKFPRSLALVGIRDIRDYLTQIRPEEASRGLASPFNIKKEA